MTTGYVFLERLMRHDTGTSGDMMPPGRYVELGRRLESPNSKRQLHNLAQVSGLVDHLVPVLPEPITVEDLLRGHTPRHVDHIRQLSETGAGFAGPQATIGLCSYEIALSSVGSSYAAMAAVLGSRVDNADALARPPGHHAEADIAMGNCLFSNIGVAVRRLEAEGRLARVAIVDWDVHHGNGTEAIFYDDPSTLTISLHQDNLYPVGGGTLDQVGSGKGQGYNINVPLPAGSGTGAYEAAFDRVVVPALEAFRPELIVVACGFAASGFDPLGRMMLDSECFRRLAMKMTAVAARTCEGRLAMSHEGGYPQGYVPFCGHAVIETLANVRTDVVDSLSEHIDAWNGQRLQPRQDATIAAAEALVAGLRDRCAGLADRAG